jgi:hypothetical protein
MREARKLEKAKDGELRGVLTSDQYTTYEGLKEQMRQRLEQRALKPDGTAP